MTVAEIDSGKVHFHCDLSGNETPLPHLWEHTLAATMRRIVLRADYQTQLRRCHEELGFRHLQWSAALSRSPEKLLLNQQL